MKINPAGLLLWRKIITSQFNIEGYSICTTRDNGFAVSGRSSDQNIYVAKFDSLESFEWGIEINPLFGSESGQFITESKDGDLIVSNGSDESSPSELLLKMNKKGGIKLIHRYNGNASFSTSIVIPTSEDGFVFTGRMGNSDSTSGIILLKTDSLLNGCHFENTLYSSHSLGEIEQDTITSVFAEIVLDTLNFKFSNIYNFKEIDLCSVSEVGPSTIQKNLPLFISPNPLHSNETLTIHSNNFAQGNYTLRISDLLGNILITEKINISSDAQDISLDVSRLSSGAFILEMQSVSEPEKIYRAKFVKED